MTPDVRIGVLTPYGPSQMVGGVETFNDSLQRALGRMEFFAGDRVDSGPREAELEHVGLDQPVGALHAARLLLRRHREEPFEIILSNGVYGWPLTLARPSVPMIQVYHFTMAGLARHALSRRGVRWRTAHVTAMFDRLAGMGKHVVVISHRLRREVESYYGLRSRFIPHAVDTHAFRPLDQGSARESIGLPPDTPVGLFVGRPENAKGYDILLRVARQMPNVLFLVAGGQPGEDEGNVRSLGHVAHEDMPLWYAASDFFFLPSRYEGFGLALLEALSCDLPAVVSQAAWPFSEEPDECGVVVEGDLEHDFAEAIRFVLSSRPRFSPREFVLPRFGFAAFRDSWREFVDSLLDAGG